MTQTLDAAALRFSADRTRAIYPNGRSFDCYFVTAAGGLTFAGLSCSERLAELWLAGKALE